MPNHAVVRVRQKLASRLLADILTCRKDGGGREVGSHAPDKPICHLWVDRTGPGRYIHTHGAQQAPTPWLLGRPDACPHLAVERGQRAERNQAGPHAQSTSQAQTGRTLGGSQKHNIPPTPLRSHSHTRTRAETNTQWLLSPPPPGTAGAYCRQSRDLVPYCKRTLHYRTRGVAGWYCPELWQVCPFIPPCGKT